MTDPRTLKAMLAEPRLPAEPSDALIAEMCDAGGWERSISHAYMRFAYRALYAHLTKPKTKTIWMVFQGAHERVQCDDALSAMQIIDGMLKRNAADIRIERREVPT